MGKMKQLKVTCKYCGGSGQVSFKISKGRFTEPILCPICKGKKTLILTSAILPADAPDPTRLEWKTDEKPQF